MIDKKKMTGWQFFILVVLYTVGTTILVIPSSIAGYAAQDAWIPTIVGTAVGLLFMLFYLSIGKLKPGANLFELNDYIFGRWIGFAVTLLLTCSSLLFTAEVLFYLGHFIVTEFMPETPLLSLNILFAIVIIMGLRHGIQAVTRTAELLFPWFVMMLLILIIFSLPIIEPKNFLPVLEANASSIFSAVYVHCSSSFFTIIFLFVLISKKIMDPQNVPKAFIIGGGVGGVIFILLITLCIGVLGPKETALDLFPSYELAKSITVAGFIQRIEAIMAILWFITVYLKTTMYMYATMCGISHLAKLRDPRILAFPLGLIVIGLSVVVYPNTIYMREWDSKTWSAYGLIIGFLYPAAMLITGRLRFRRKKKQMPAPDAEQVPSS